MLKAICRLCKMHFTSFSRPNVGGLKVHEKMVFDLVDFDLQNNAKIK